MIIIGVDEVGRAASKRRAPPRRTIFIGIDEVGRGAFAGPITVGAVAAAAKSDYQITNSKSLLGIRDSKKLTPKQREGWSAKLRSEKGFYCVVASVSAGVIDRAGISYAARLAVALALAKIRRVMRVESSYVRVLLDGGLFAPSLYPHQDTIVKGDEKVPLIAAASIIAKVHRDALMSGRYDKRFPIYGFSGHKGYGTRAHRKAIKRHGTSGLHRQSFLHFDGLSAS